MNYKITEIMPRWKNYTMKLLMPTGAEFIEFEGGTARTNKEAIAEHFRRNPLRYQVEME